MKVPGRENAREWGHWGEGRLLRAWDSKTSGGKKPQPPVPAHPLYLPLDWGGLPCTCSKSSTVYREGKAGGGGGLARPLSWHAPGMLFTERPVL